MDPKNPVSRRNVLIGGLMGAVAYVAAACSNAISSLSPKPSVAASAAPTAAPTAVASAAPAKPLRFWMPPMKGDGSSETFWKDQMAAYTALSGTPVEVRIIPWESLLETYTTGYSGTEPPDVVYLVPDFLGRFAKGGQLRDMGSVPAATTWQSAFRPDFWGGAAYIGKQWGPPNVASAPAFIWNKAHFTDVGLDPEVGPKTWEDVRSYAKKLTKPGGSAGDSASSSRTPKP